jgi:hypothetical protein
MKVCNLFFVVMVLLVCCKEHASLPNKNENNTKRDSLYSKLIDTSAKKTAIMNFNTSKESKNDSNDNSKMACNDLLLLLIKKSSFNSEVKKFKFKVFVDELSAGIATLKITLRNTERNEDMVISWLKMDTKRNKLLDITVDPDNPIELKYDTTLFKRIVNNCKF